MIVLDEQLMGRGIKEEIAKWYRGSVKFVTDLRPESVIKDDAIPGLLRAQNSPTFITINVSDFWCKVAADKKYCIVCFALPDSRAKEIPGSLRSILGRPEFSTKASRSGTVLRVIENRVSYYTVAKNETKRID